MAARKIGLALAGGGPGGAMYEIGALRALEEALEGVDFTALHTYVGVSAGAVVASSLANGISPAQMARAIARPEPGEPPLRPEIFFTPFYKEWRRRSLKLPRLFLDVVLRIARQPRDRTLLESLARLGGALPVALFDNEPIRRFLATTFAREGRTDDFRKLRRELVVVATDLEAGRPIRFGERGWDRVPISKAVQASTAFPGLYPPVTINDRECVDGVLLKTMHASVALEHGARLVFCINPIVPIDIAAGTSRGLLEHGVLLERGLPAILSQTFRTMIHSRLEVGMAAYRTRYPGSDVLLFEPDSDEYRMFFTNVFRFGARQSVCERAYALTRATLRRGYATFARRLARHGVHLRKDILDDASRDLWTSVGIVEEHRSPLAVELDRTLQDLADLVTPARP